MKTENKRKIGALDVFIIIALAACVVCIGIRFFATSRSQVSEKVQLEDYIISIKVEAIKDSSAKNYMTPDTNFYIKETGTYFGSLLEGLTIKDAQKSYEMPNGDVVMGENNAVGDLYRVDVEAKLVSKGKVDDSGRFLLGGNTYVGANKEFNLYSKYLAIKVTVTGVEKAQ